MDREDLASGMLHCIDTCCTQLIEALLVLHILMYVLIKHNTHTRNAHNDVAAWGTHDE